jgi:hypothetical protein
LSSWNSFCVVVDQTKQTLIVSINGKVAPLTGAPKLGPSVRLEKSYITLGNFNGELTELNVWSFALTTGDIVEYAAGASCQLPCTTKLFSAVINIAVL